MSLRLLDTEQIGDPRTLTVAAKLYRDSDYDEYRVRLYVNGVLQLAADYFTNDKADAQFTMLAMANTAYLMNLVRH
jgi:hypothetical protein